MTTYRDAVPSSSAMRGRGAAPLKRLTNVCNICRDRDSPLSCAGQALTPGARRILPLGSGAPAAGRGRRLALPASARLGPQVARATEFILFPGLPS
jgi:hypothetical protein